MHCMTSHEREVHKDTMRLERTKARKVVAGIMDASGEPLYPIQVALLTNNLIWLQDEGY